MTCVKPSVYQIELMAQTCGRVLGATNTVLLRRAITPSESMFSASLVLKAFEQVRGNRPCDLPESWDDLRLTLAAILRGCLTRLEEPDAT